MVDENTLGREPVIIVEIDQDFCQNTYGSAPCTASIGTTGTFKCYNTLPTCQDTTNYATGTAITLRFCTRTAGFPVRDETVQYIPMVDKVTTNPTELNLAGGNDSASALGRRASVTISMTDIPYNDYLVDNYLADRGFDPLTKSSFWTKWLARNRYYQGRALRVREGYVGQTVSSMRTRHYVIDKISGADSRGKVTIVARDILNLADNKKAVAPTANTGVLLADIDDSTTSATLSPTGIGNSEYAASGKLIIGDEIMSFTRSGDALTLTRAQNNTTASSHSADDAVQECLTYTDQRVDVVMRDLLTTYGNIDSSYITTADWTAEADVWLADANLTTVITEPTGVTKLLSELCEQLLIVIWWDDVNQKIRFRAVRPVNDADIVTITEDANILENSFEMTRKPEERLSQSGIYYDIFDYTGGLTDTSNFSKAQIAVDLNAESADQYGIPSIRTLYSRWLGAEDAGIALSSMSKTILSYKNPPIYISFALDAKDRDLDVADVIRVTHRALVDAQGDTTATLFFVISREDIENGHSIKYTCVNFGYIGRFAYIMDNSANDYPSATEAELAQGAYISDNNGFMSDGTEGWKIS